MKYLAFKCFKARRYLTAVCWQNQFYNAIKLKYGSDAFKIKINNHSEQKVDKTCLESSELKTHFYVD